MPKLVPWQPQNSISAHVQDYAKAVYALEDRQGEAVSTNDLAERLGVTPGRSRR